MRERWMDNYYIHRDHVLWSIPYPLRIFIGYKIYRNLTTTLNGQGTGRFTDAELQAFSKELWTTINGLLAESKRKARERWTSWDSEGCFWALGGPEPTECDTTLYGFINSALVAAR